MGSLIIVAYESDAKHISQPEVLQDWNMPNYSYEAMYTYNYKRSNSNEIAQTRMQHKGLSLTSTI